MLLNNSSLGSALSLTAKFEFRSGWNKIPTTISEPLKAVDIDLRGHLFCDFRNPLCIVLQIVLWMHVPDISQEIVRQRKTGSRVKVLQRYRQSSRKPIFVACELRCGIKQLRIKAEFWLVVRPEHRFVVNECHAEFRPDIFVNCYGLRIRRLIDASLSKRNESSDSCRYVLKH